VFLDNGRQGFMSNTPVKYPELPPELRGGMNWRLLSFFGAGAILASTTIGSGETLFASRSGAVFGYTLLWCFIAGCVMKGIQVYTGARYMVLTGQHPMTSWSRLPGPRNWVPLLFAILSLLCLPFIIAGLLIILGKHINWVMAINWQVDLSNDDDFTKWVRIWGILTLISVLLLTWLQTYGVLEKIQTVLVGLLLFCVLAACMVAQPDWMKALLGSILPVIPEYQDWVVLKYPAIAERSPVIEAVVYLGVIGGGTYDYIGYLGFLREKKWGALGLEQTVEIPADNSASWTIPLDTDEENRKRARRWLLPVKIDIGGSFLSLVVFTVCFYLLGAAILHSKELIPADKDLLSHQAMFLTELHPSLLYLYQIGIFAAIWGSIYGALELYVRTTYECITPLSQKFRAIPLSSVRRVVLTFIGILSLVIMFKSEDPIAVLTLPLIVGGVFTCGLWCFAMIWTDRHFMPKAFQMKSTLLVLTIISGIAMTVLGFRALWNYFGKYFAA
jgi:Mn2+/Fe2+ NRAMP family transporter